MDNYYVLLTVLLVTRLLLEIVIISYYCLKNRSKIKRYITILLNNNELEE